MPRNFFVTGAKNRGKTTLLKRLIQELNLLPSGYETLPYVIEGKIMGHYFHSLAAVNEIENNLPFTVRHTETSCLKVPEVFTLLGTAALEASLGDDSKVILMDEIGTVEKDCGGFLNCLENVLDSEKIVLGVVKKAQSPNLAKLMNRPDIFLVDLDKTPQETAFERLKIQLEEQL